MHFYKTTKQKLIIYTKNEVIMAGLNTAWMTKPIKNRQHWMGAELEQQQERFRWNLWYVF